MSPSANERHQRIIRRMPKFSCGMASDNIHTGKEESEKSKLVKNCAQFSYMREVKVWKLQYFMLCQLLLHFLLSVLLYLSSERTFSSKSTRSGSSTTNHIERRQTLILSQPGELVLSPLCISKYSWALMRSTCAPAFTKCSDNFKPISYII